MAPRLIFAGACHGIVINYGHGQENVSNMWAPEQAI